LENNQAAAAYLEKSLQAADVALIKGSNSQRLDEIISALTVAEPETRNVAR
jgi:UDP-N-acetylmuramyl pentapeptide synthase